MNGHPAGSQKATVQAKEPSGGQRVKTKTSLGSWRNQAFGTVAERFHDGVADKTDRGIGRKDLGEAAQFPRSPPVIAVEKGDHLAAALGNAEIERGSLASVGFLQDANAGTKCAQDGGGAVGRTVVNYDDFVSGGREILVERTAHGVLDKTLVIVGIDEYAEEHGVCAILLRARNISTRPPARQAVEIGAPIALPSYIGHCEQG